MRLLINISFQSAGDQSLLEVYMHFFLPVERLLEFNKAALVACVSHKLTRPPLENEHTLTLGFLITLN